MPASPRINFRISEKLAAKLDREAKKRKKTASETAREIIAEALDAEDLAAVQTAGRKKLSENLKIV